MVYTIQEKGWGRCVHRTVVVQYDCNSVGLTGGRGSTMVRLVHDSVEVNEYLVKAKPECGMRHSRDRYSRVTAISAPTVAPLPDGVRPRSARESLHRLCACT